MPDPDLVAGLSKLLTTLPGISEVKAANHATFKGALAFCLIRQQIRE